MDCCSSREEDLAIELHDVHPDEDWCADTKIVLSRGITAFRYDEPDQDGQADHVPLVVCLHDMTNSSYMWKDLSRLLVNSLTGPPARILTYDIYGRGRSPLASAGE